MIVDIGSNAAADGVQYVASGGDGSYYKAATDS
ncbi:unnamed protein product, partial [marine sediment metagenome]